MKEYIPYKEPIPYIVVKNYFDEKDVELMLQEANLVRSSNIMFFEDGVNLPEGHKKNEQASIDSIYQNREVSHILTTFNKIYEDEKLINTLKDMSWFYKYWEYTNRDKTFINYSKKGDYYKRHTDLALISFMYWLWEEPKSFTGGDILFPDYDIKTPIEKNQLMIIPSSTEHEILPITDGFGRWCIVRFLYLLPENN